MPVPRRKGLNQVELSRIISFELRGSLVSGCAAADYDRRCSGRSASSRVHLRSKTGPCGGAMPAEARGGCVERHANPSLADIDEPVRTIGIVASADAVLEPAGRWLRELVEGG